MGHGFHPQTGCSYLSHLNSKILLLQRHRKEYLDIFSRSIYMYVSLHSEFTDIFRIICVLSCCSESRQFSSSYTYLFVYTHSYLYFLKMRFSTVQILQTRWEVISVLQYELSGIVWIRFSFFTPIIYTVAKYKFKKVIISCFLNNILRVVLNNFHLSGIRWHKTRVFQMLLIHVVSSNMCVHQLVYL